MSSPAAQSSALARLQRAALVLGSIALLASALLGWLAPQAFAPAYRFAAFACLAPALGSLIFQLMLRMTGGQWGPGLHPFLAAGTTLLPWTWLLTLPLLFFPARTVLEHTEHRDLYASPAMVCARAVLYGVAFALLAWGLPHVRRRRVAGDHLSLRWVAPAGLIALVFLLHLLAEDWLVSLDPGWHSTAFPTVWMAGQAVAGLAVALACAIAAGARPDEDGAEGRPLGLDWGNLLLAGTMFFAYVAFAQWLIIWSGNLPREISWYQLRSHGGWFWVIIAIAVLHFALPFLGLLSRRVKRAPAALAAVSLLLLLAQFTYLAWLILPAFSPLDFRSLALAFTLPAAALGLFLNRYLAAARRLQESAA